MNEAEIVVTHAAEFRRCLVDLDIAGIRRLWAHVSPHLPQPANDEEALYTLHLARTKTPTLPLSLRTYSKKWLQERQVGRIAYGVGIAIAAPLHRRKQALSVRAAMSDAVTRAVNAGVSLETESDEIKKRMLIARDKETGNG